ncbi:Uma2 family endonuclease [Pleurocapsales cyanobacterium LEGE 10410]|nr:Uma2 family endonuclease [Pleurocapsales cyanobacterium LEGE 10410]
MIASQTKPINFEEFLAWYPEDSQRYELIEGVIVKMLPTGSHEDVSGFLIAELNWEIRQQNLPYSIPKNCLLKPLAPRSGYLPDVAIVNREYIKDEPLWEKSSVIQNGKTVPLVIEVVSTNWRDDYGHKFVEYEAMGIEEYWLVDYRALGAVRHIGQPKQPTITICKLIEGEYQIEKFVKGDYLKSSVFPQLELTTEAIFAMGKL